MKNKNFLEMTQEVVNRVQLELTALITKSLEDNLKSVDDVEVPPKTIIVDKVEEGNDSSIDDDTKSLMERYQLTQEEVEEVQSMYSSFSGSLEPWEVENWKSNQKKLLIELFDESYTELYIDEGNDNEIISYSTLEDRVTNNPSYYLDIEDVIAEHYDPANKDELMSILGCEEEDGEEE